MSKQLLSLLIPILLMTHSLSAAEPLNPGEMIPHVQATDQDGNILNLGEIGKTGLTLVYFYPRADTGGCTAQACSLRDSYQKLSEKGVKIFGVSTDTPEAQKKFKEKHRLPFTLLADPDHKVIDAFRVPLKSEKPVATRQAFLFKDGKLIWKDLKASTKEQAEDVLKAIETPSSPTSSEKK